MPGSPAKSLTSTAASPPDTSLDPPRDAEELRSAGGARGDHRRPISCARYTGEISDDTRQAAIRLAWPEPYRLTIAADNPSFSWEVTFAATPASRVLSALAQRLPGQFLANESVLRVLGPVAGILLGAGRLALTGKMPNRQTFHLVPSHVWMVTASRAQLGATDSAGPRRSPGRRPSAISASPRRPTRRRSPRRRSPQPWTALDLHRPQLIPGTQLRPGGDLLCRPRAR